MIFTCVNKYTSFIVKFWPYCKSIVLQFLAKNGKTIKGKYQHIAFNSKVKSVKAKCQAKH